MSPATTSAAVLELDRPAGALQRRPALSIPVGGWRERAACQSLVTSAANDPFFTPDAPDGEPHPETVARVRRAKGICNGCEVRQACLLWALMTREPHGVWGGKTAGERRQMLAAKGHRLERYLARSAVGGG